MKVFLNNIDLQGVDCLGKAMVLAGTFGLNSQDLTNSPIKRKMQNFSCIKTKVNLCLDAKQDRALTVLQPSCTDGNSGDRLGGKRGEEKSHHWSGKVRLGL